MKNNKTDQFYANRQLEKLLKGTRLGAKLAEHLGLNDRSTITQIIRCNRLIKSHELIKIAEFFDQDIGYFLSPESSYQKATTEDDLLSAAIDLCHNFISSLPTKHSKLITPQIIKELTIFSVKAIREQILSGKEPYIGSVTYNQLLDKLLDGR